MHELLDIITNMQAHAKKLKALIVLVPSDSSGPLREALYMIEAAIYAMERTAADAYQAA